MIYWQLFLSFLQIGMFSFGGGYAALPLIQEQVVTQHGWLSRSEFTDLITISQMTPGPIAVNSATFVGIRLAGFLGALAATFGCILPSCILVTVLSYLYLKYRKMSMLQGVLETCCSCSCKARIIFCSLFCTSAFDAIDAFTLLNSLFISWCNRFAKAILSEPRKECEIKLQISSILL